MNILKWKGLDVDPMIISESLTAKAEISQIDTNFNESTNESGITVLYPKIEAIHEGRTRNYNRYTAEKLKGDYELKSGVYSWTQPYPKPVIHNHDTLTEATGRVHSASFTEFTAAGRPGIIVTPKITQEKAIKDILEGRLLTVSIGATTNAAICSLCGTDIINEGFCGHMRGEEYDGQVVEWIAGDLFFDELSWVNVPADPDAMVLGTGLTNNHFDTTEKIAIADQSIDASAITAATLGTEKMVIQAGTIDAGKVEAREETIEKMKEAASKSDSANTTLTPEDGVVKSVSESTVKEEENVEENQLTPEATPAITPEVTPETAQEAAPEITPEQTQEEAPAIEDKEAEVVTEETIVPEETVPTEEVPVVTETTTATEETPKEEVQPDLTDALQVAQDDLKEALKTIDDLKTANLLLAKAQQEATVNFLVDLRMAIGKESSRDEAVEKFASRSLESLNDSIADILVEKPTFAHTRTVETVVKPTGASIAESKTLATKEVKVISNEDAIYNLLKGL